MQNMTNYHSPSGINALIILYYLESKQRFIINKSESRKANPLSRYSIGAHYKYSKFIFSRYLKKNIYFIFFQEMKIKIFNIFLST
jgi:hypothetical protein